jgi:lysozyme family protein
VDATDYDPVFLKAVERVLENEGGYVDSPDDPGGETKFGISRRHYPQLDIENLTRADAIQIYWRDWWRKYGYGALPSPVSAKMLDLAVNVGPSQAARCLQRALRACGANLAEDGTLGPATLAAALHANQIALLAALRSEAAGHYRLIAASKHLHAETFLEGWLKRAYE